MLGTIQKYRGTGKMKGFLQSNEPGSILSFSKYDVKISYKFNKEGKPASGGLVIEVSDDEFIVAGIGFTLEFESKAGNVSKVGYVRVEEGTFVQDEWIRGRVLNGDESTYGIIVGSLPSVLCVEVYPYR